MCKHSVLFYTTTTMFLHVSFYKAASILVVPICSHRVHFILHMCLQAIRINLLRLGEVHTSNVYVVVVGVLPSCCICLCILKYQTCLLLVSPTDVVFVIFTLALAVSRSFAFI